MQRDLRLDVLRITAIVAVIWLHVSGEVVVSEPGPGDTEWWMGNLADAFSRWCVPLFVMASGALILPRRPDIAPWDFYRRRAARIVIPTLFWTMIYLGVRAIGDDASVRSLAISVVRGAPYYHLWFLYMIAGLYLATPLISRFLDGSPQGVVLAATGLAFLVSSIESLVAEIVDGERAYTFLGMWPAYLGYFLAGYYLWRWPLRRVSWTLVLATILACGIGIAVLTAALYQFFGARAWQITYANLQPLVVLMSLAIFTSVAGSSMRFSPAATRIVGAVTPLVLGVYVMHPLWLLVLKDRGIDGFLVNPTVGIPVTTALAFALSLASARAVAATPVLRRTI
jgi:surface polysaccharide O-acyltransferase-like enzyme